MLKNEKLKVTVEDSENVAISNSRGAMRKLVIVKPSSHRVALLPLVRLYNRSRE